MNAPCELKKSTARLLGLSWYFTGKVCKNGHLTIRQVVSNVCNECLKLGRKKYKKDHKERVYQLANKRLRERRASDPIFGEKQRAMDRSRYAVRSESIKRRVKAWAKNNPERVIDNRSEYRRRKRDSCTERLPNGTINRLCALQKFRCASCEKPLVLSGKGKFHVDHITPLAKGGGHTPSNLQILCPTCNHQKSAIDPITFMQRKGKLL